MGLSKPYFRIFRPYSPLGREYLFDPRFSPDRFSYIHSYHLIESDIKVLFDYISPHDSNLTTFSHRIYELFFRCCTEFENNAKAILSAHGYTSGGGIMNIANDYFKINRDLKLHEYEVRLNLWDNNPKILKPFVTWSGTTYSPLSWYRDYNSVKHNRSISFHLAKIENLINAAAGLLIILYAQYGYLVFSPYQIVSQTSRFDDFETSNDCIFEVKPPNWTDAEKYDFNWSTLESTPNPFDSLTF